MPNLIIDLRKVDRSRAPERKIERKGNLIEWSAYEYEKKVHGPYWVLFPGFVALAVILLGILSKNYFFIVFMVLAFVVLVMYDRREPKKINFAVTPSGVKAGSKMYDFKDLKSFYVFDKPDIRELSLEAVKTWMPYVRFPLGKADAEDLKGTLVEFLPEKEHAEFASDRIARNF